MCNLACPFTQITLADGGILGLDEKKNSFEIFALSLCDFNNLSVDPFYQPDFSLHSDGFLCYFWQRKGHIYIWFCKDLYTICIINFSTGKVDNCVEKLNNYDENPLFLTKNGRG